MLSLGAMTFAAALVVSMSIPANAFITDAGIPAPVVSAERQQVLSQTIAVPENVEYAAPARDGFDVTTYAEMLRLKYGNVSPTYTATTGAIRWPFPYPVTITDRFGDRPNGSAGTSHHNGVDFTPGNGTPIYAVADGVVTEHEDD